METLTYYESADSLLINENRVRVEVMDHGGAEIDVETCLKEVKPDAYGLRDAQAVLKWLGY